MNHYVVETIPRYARDEKGHKYADWNCWDQNLLTPHGWYARLFYWETKLVLFPVYKTRLRKV